MKNKNFLTVSNKFPLAWAEVDLSALKQNLKIIRSRLSGSGTQILSVVKANAYGHGMKEVAKTLQKEGINFFGVATIQEAMDLRRVCPKERPRRMLVDTHCHLHFDAFDADRDKVIERAKEFGLKYLVNVGTDPVTNQAALELAKKYDFIFHTAGLHPHHSHEVSEENLNELRKFVIQNKPHAIGEIGLDYFKSEADPETQKKAFIAMLRLAVELKLPVIVHSRNAFEDTVKLIKQETQGKIKGVMHCFSYDEASLKVLLDLGFLVSFTCNLTFKNAGPLLEVAKKAPLDRIMLETDSPYLAPQIYRGKRNEPSCLTHLAQFLSAERGISQEKLEQVTTDTAIQFFNLPPLK